MRHVFTTPEKVGRNNTPAFLQILINFILPDARLRKLLQQLSEPFATQLPAHGNIHADRGDQENNNGWAKLFDQNINTGKTKEG